MQLHNTSTAKDSVAALHEFGHQIFAAVGIDRRVFRHLTAMKFAHLQQHTATTEMGSKGAFAANVMNVRSGPSLRDGPLN